MRKSHILKWCGEWYLVSLNGFVFRHYQPFDFIAKRWVSELMDITTTRITHTCNWVDPHKGD